MVDWVGQTLPTGTAQEGWKAACWDGTYFYLFDDAGGSTHKVLRSPSAAAGSWALQTCPAVNVNAASGVDGTVVAVGTGGDLLRTANSGGTWTADTMPSANNWVSVANNGSRFVAIHGGSNANNQSAYSDNGGASWTSVAIPGTTHNWRTVMWTGTKFVAIGYNGPGDRGAISTSTNGTSWSAPANITTVSYDPIWAANIGGTIVVVAHVPTFETVRSTDHGANWTRVDTGLTILNSGNTVSIHATPAGFYVLGYDLDQPLFSPDGITWVNANFPGGTTVGYFLPGSHCGSPDDVNVAASSYQASFAMTVGEPPAVISSSFFHFTFGG